MKRHGYERPRDPEGTILDGVMFNSGLAIGQRIFIVHPEIGEPVPAIVTGQVPNTSYVMVRIEATDDITMVPLDLIREARKRPRVASGSAERTYEPGERVYRYVWTGGEEWNPQALTIVSRSGTGQTYVVRTDQGSEFRLKAGEIMGYADWGKEASIFWNPGPLFHGTIYAKEIMEQGFVIPDNPQRGSDYGPAVYLTPDREWAHGYGPKVLEVSVSPGAKILDLTQLWVEDVIDHSYESLNKEEVMALAKAHGCVGVYDGDVVAIYDTSALNTKTASSWRGFVKDDEPFWKWADVVIATERAGRGRYFEVYVHGEVWRNFPRLDDAKAALIAEFGGLEFTQHRMEPVTVDHYYYGPMDDFTTPLTIYLADF